MGETNQVKWRGVRPTEPAEPFPVKDKDGDKIFSFKGIISEWVRNENLPGGDVHLEGTPVPAGEVWNITQTYCLYSGTAPRGLVIYAITGGRSIMIHDTRNPGVDRYYPQPCNVYLREGDRVALFIQGATAGDIGELGYAGIKMTAP